MQKKYLTFAPRIFKTSELCHTNIITNMGVVVTSTSTTTSITTSTITSTITSIIMNIIMSTEAIASCGQ